MSSPPKKTRRIGSSPKSPEINNGIIAYLEHKLSRTFPDLTILISNGKGDETHKTEIHGYSCSDHQSCECFNLVVNHSDSHILVDRVRYKYGDKCALSGTDIMTRLVRVFHAMQKKGFPHRVQLYDRARVKIRDDDGEEHNVFLAFHYIMQHGIPWYAKFGFRTPRFDYEVATNETNMNKAIPPMFLKRLNGFLDKDKPMERGTTFRQAAKMLYERSNSAYLELYDYLVGKNLLKYAEYDMWLLNT